ncbi:MAG: galactitol-1-phosphate 5-dehydrogenase [Phycisphaerae bacterium]|nr:galactitol-1-phosphate 5-dehydrogenase [Phycisphaerae bacterium]
MKALVLTQVNHFELQDVPCADVGDQDVLIQVMACGICGSDVHGMDGSTGRRRPPIIMGHEASGVIAVTGSEVRDWSVGDRVTFDSTIYCGECHFCQQGHINLCDQRRVLGVSCDEYRQHGAFADCVVVPQHIVYRLPKAVTFAQGAMVEAVSIAVHAVTRTTLCPGDTAVVVGTGVIGLLVIQALHAEGCRQVIAIDIDQGKLDLAQSLGADVTLNPAKTDILQTILSRTDGRGADVAFEVVGMTSPVQTAISALRKGGQLTLVGNLSAHVDFPLQAVVTRELTVYGSCASCGEYPICLDLMAREEIKVDPLISAQAPLADGAAWFKRLYDRERGLIKVILEPNHA